jgi:hypothetical protein
MAPLLVTTVHETHLSHRTLKYLDFVPHLRIPWCCSLLSNLYFLRFLKALSFDSSPTSITRARRTTSQSGNGLDYRPIFVFISLNWEGITTPHVL